jgi:uncharacterized MAPEG superfamily protein
MNGIASESEEEWSDEEQPIKPSKMLDEKGLPAEAPYGKVNPAIVYPIANVILLGIGLLIAWGVYSISWKTYDARVAVLKQHDLGYLYLAVFLMSLVLPMQQVFVAYHRKMAKVDNPDQYISKTMLKDDPYVRLEQDGPVGAFNRAQRGIDNTREMFATTVLNLVFAGYVFPVPVLVMSIVYLVGRIAYSAGYISAGSMRVPGMLLSMVASIVINGLQLFATIQIFRSV